MGGVCTGLARVLWYGLWWGNDAIAWVEQAGGSNGSGSSSSESSWEWMEGGANPMAGW